MSDENPDLTLQDVLEVSQRALSKNVELRETVEDLQERVEDLEEEKTALEMRMSDWEENRSYEDYSLDEKIGMVREEAFRRATDSYGKSTLDYSDVRRDVFDGEPSPSHCYKLMRKAAEMDGFEFVDEPKSSDKNKRVICDASTAKATPAFYPENKPVQEEGR